MKEKKTSTKAIILENGFEIDITDELIEHLEKKGIEWEWFNMNERFWPENKENTVEIFENFPKGQEFYCHTVFDGFQQLELMIALLYHLKDKNFKIKIMHNMLCDELVSFFEEKESSITPKELTDKLGSDISDKEYKLTLDLIYAFKVEIRDLPMYLKSMIYFG